MTEVPMNDELSPLEKIAALTAQLKELKAGASEAMQKEATEKFTPLHEQFVAAVAAIGNDEDGERAAHALRWLGDNVVDYRKAARAYHKYVLGVAAVRKPRTPDSDTSAETDAEPKKGKKAA